MSAPAVVQLYSVREGLRTDAADTVRRLADTGFSRAEGYRLADLPALPALLAAHGISMPSAHERTVSAAEDTDLSAVFARAAAQGVELVIDPAVPAARWRAEDGIARIADDMNAAADVAAAHGTRLGYHNHAHELFDAGDGRTALEHLSDRLDDRVALELDVYWAMRAGADPVALVAALGERIAALHLKDAPAGSEDVADQVALGLGDVPYGACIDAAPRDALRVVEFDDTRGDLFQALAVSLAALEARADA